MALSEITKTVLGGLAERVKEKEFSVEEAKQIWGGKVAATFTDLTENQKLQLLVSAILDDLVKAVDHAQKLEVYQEALVTQNKEMRERLLSYGNRAQRRAQNG